MRPEAVVNDDKNIMTLAYGNMMGLMVEAMKELEEIVKRQDLKLIELEKKIT